MNPVRIGALAVLLLSLAASAEDQAAKRAMARYRELRPSDDDLVMYRLDWEPDYDAALRRAAKEKRPLFVVVIYAKYGELYSGHC